MACLAELSMKKVLTLGPVSNIEDSHNVNSVTHQ